MNKITGCTILSFLFCIVARSQSIIILEVTNLKSDNGVCRACLFNNQASYEGKTSKPFQCISGLIKAQNAKMKFSNISSGTYAIFVYHDANNNNKMDRNFIGIPKEGYGASKNNLPYASAPAFNENQFTIDNKTQVILPVRIRNL